MDLNYKKKGTIRNHENLLCNFLGNKLCRGAHKSSQIKFAINLPFVPIISNGKVFHPLCNMYDQLIEQNRPFTPNDFKIIDCQSKLLKFE